MAALAVNRVVRHLRLAALRPEGAGPTDGELLQAFIAHRDEAAFEGLVRRHGAMVLGVCRRLLRNHADAEDAFQATFLVLVRKAASIRTPSAVSNWLYGVAHTTALKAKAMNRKRRTRELEAGCQPRHSASEEAWQAVQALLDTELIRLSDKYRMAIVLCDLEGKTIREAARHLGCPQGTIAARLARGRALLARRLAKQGLVLSAGALSAALTQATASASVPPSLVSSTVKATSALTAGQAALAGLVSAKVAALTQGVVQAMFLTQLKSCALGLFTLVVLGAGVGAICQGTLAQDTGGKPALQKQVQGGGDVNLLQEIERLRAELAKTRLELQKAQAELALVRAQAELDRLNREQGNKPPLAKDAAKALLELGAKAEYDRALLHKYLGDTLAAKAAHEAAKLKPDAKADDQPSHVSPKTAELDLLLRLYKEGAISKAVLEAARLKLEAKPAQEPPTIQLRYKHADLEALQRLYEQGILSKAVLDSVREKLKAAPEPQLPKDPGAKPPPVPLPKTTTESDTKKPDWVGKLAAISEDGKFLAAVEGPVVILLDLQTGKPVVRFSGHKAPVTDVLFSPDGKLIITGGSDAMVCVWNLPTGKLISSVNVPRAVGTVRFSADGKRLIVIDSERVLHEIELTTGKTIRVVPPEKAK
jgi:RNA polymerase sigma factor (sigma-70 family)